MQSNGHCAGAWGLSGFFRVLALAGAAFCLAPLAWAGTTPATNGVSPAASETHVSAFAGKPWRFRLGPVFEWSHDRRGVDEFALRPLFSRASDDAQHEHYTDVIWPWSSFHEREKYFDWWAFPAFGKDENVDAPLSRHTLWLLPIYCEGRTRAGHNFAAVFPLGGTVCDFLGMDQMEFLFFPLYVGYHQGHQTGECYLWPIYCRETGPVRDKYRVFPFYGRMTNATERDSFVLWPFWTEQTFDGPKKKGTAEMLFPIYGSVNTDKQKGWMVLPPFFSYLKSEDETKLHCPWPFYQKERLKNGDKTAYWPLWDDTRTSTGERRYILWPCWWEYRSEASDRCETSSYLVPFYYQDQFAHKVENHFVSDMDYLRIWPLFSQSRSGEDSRFRFLELSPLRDARGLESNWAPFWSLYVCERHGSAYDHDVLWGLARWGKQCDDIHYGQVGPFFFWSHGPQASLEWSFLSGLIGREGQGDHACTRWLWFFHSGQSADENRKQCQ